MIRRLVSLVGICVLTLVWLTLTVASQAHAAPPTPIPCAGSMQYDASQGMNVCVAKSDPATNLAGCTKEGVLISLSRLGTSASNYGSPDCIEHLQFKTYLRIFLDENFPLVMFAAVAMVIVAGLQYMLSGFTPGEAAKAKLRIVGIITGIVFYLLIRLILNLLKPGIGLSVLPMPATVAVSDLRG